MERYHSSRWYIAFLWFIFYDIRWKSILYLQVIIRYSYTLLIELCIDNDTIITFYKTLNFCILQDILIKISLTDRSDYNNEQ